MLFNSYEFIFVFFPIVAVIYFAASYFGARIQVFVLALSSLIFYCGWDIRYLPLLLTSVVGNLLVGRTIVARKDVGLSTRWALGIGVTGNLALLGYYKYTNFFIDTANDLGASIPEINVILPLGISFFTFTQIAFLVDAHRGKTDKPKIIEYLAFVTYFPHLIAGPIIHHHETIPQFRRSHPAKTYWIAPGIALFSIGLAKKVLVADTFGLLARPVFDAFAATNQTMTSMDAWFGALCFTFQLYFDFSAYSDMAVGISLMLGIYIPLNFDSPYKATSVIDFWRRWHMTLSRWLRDYLYISLGGNRRGQVRRYLNLFLTMLIGGLWHGAGWTFVIWGGLHGAYLVVNHGFRTLFPTPLTPAWTWIARILTFLCVVVGWVFFKAADLPTALRMVGAMASVPTKFSSDIFVAIVDSTFPLSIRDASLSVVAFDLAMPAIVAAGLISCWFFPNSQEIVFRRMDSPWATKSLENAAVPAGINWPHWFGPVAAMLAMCSLVALISAPPGEFLYFMF